MYKLVVSLRKRPAWMALCVISFTATLSASSHDVRNAIVDKAKTFLGVPYVYGAESPEAFDCSGFVRYVYRQVTGMELPRCARDYPLAGEGISFEAAEPGDVIVFDTVGGRASHVAIYMGSGKMIHAASAGAETGIIISSVSERYWAPKVLGVRSFLAKGQGGAVATTGSAQTADRSSVSERNGATAGGSIEADIISDIGFTIPPSRSTETDAIPVKAGTSVAYTVTNGTGKKGTFIVIFYRTDPITYAMEELHKVRIDLDIGKSYSLPAFTHRNPGKYKLIVKDTWGNQLLERIYFVR
jgi:hypothetical protein